MNFMSSRAAKQAADEIKTLREDLTIHTEDGAAFPSQLSSMSVCTQWSNGLFWSAHGLTAFSGLHTVV